MSGALNNLPALKKDSRKANRIQTVDQSAIGAVRFVENRILYAAGIAQHGANITSVDIIEERQTYFEIDVTDEPAVMIDELSKLPIVRRVGR
jgi:hypothetical protein